MLCILYSHRRGARLPSRVESSGVVESLSARAPVKTVSAPTRREWLISARYVRCVDEQRELLHQRCSARAAGASVERCECVTRAHERLDSTRLATSSSSSERFHEDSCTQHSAYMSLLCATRAESRQWQRVRGLDARNSSHWIIIFISWRTLDDIHRAKKYVWSIRVLANTAHTRMRTHTLRRQSSELRSTALRNCIITPRGREMGLCPHKTKKNEK